MMNTRTHISLLQLFMIYVNTAFGAGILTLPRTVGSVAREDMWLSVILGGLAMSFSLWCAVSLSGRFPDMTALEYHPLLLGTMAGQLLNVVYLLQMAFAGAAALRLFSSAVRMFLFDLTPIYIFMGIFLGVAAYAGQYGVAPLVRMQQLFVFSTGPIFLALILFGLLQVNLQQMLPFFAGGIMPVLKGAVPSWFSYSGPELLTGLLFPFITRKQKAFKTGLASLTVLITVYTMTTLIVQGILGAEEVGTMVFPTIMAYRDVEIPDTFIERVDGYLLIFNIVIYFVSLANFLYFTAFGCSRLLQLEYSRPCIVLLAPVFYLLAMLPNDVEQLNAFYRLVNMSSFFWGLVVLPGLLIVAKVRRLGGYKR